MVFNQINQNVKNAQATRCSSRKTRPPEPYPPHFPAYLLPNYTTQQYNFQDTQGNSYQGWIGNKMEVILLPGAYIHQGSAPGKDELEPITRFLRTSYPQYNFIKGHMWNQEVGGKGETQNLIPLTQAANSAHKNHAETPIKDSLRDFGSFYRSLVNQPDHADFAKVYGFKYVVEIENEYWVDVAEHIVPNSIHVQVVPLKCDIGGNVSDDNSIINTINSITKPKIEELIKGIWISQAGIVTDR